MEDQLLISPELRQTQKTPAPTAAYLQAKSGSDALSEVTLENCAQKLFHFQIVGIIMNNKLVTPASKEILTSPVLVYCSFPQNRMNEFAAGKVQVCGKVFNFVLKT